MTTVLACNNPWGKGGQGNFLSRAAGGLRELSDLHVFCTEPAPMPAPNLEFSLHAFPQSRWGTFIKRTPLLRRRRDWISLASDRHFDRHAAAALQELDADLVIGVAGQSRLLLEQARRQGARPWLYCLNTYLPFMKAQIDQELEVLGEPVREMPPTMIERFEEECRLADRILVNSDVARRTFLDAGVPDDTLEVILPVVDPERFRPVDKPDDIFRVLHVGTICPRKGVHYLVPAFLEADLPGAELLLVGGVSTPRLRTWLSDVLAEHPTIHNEIHNFSTDDPRPVFGRCSVLVLASVEDGFGVVGLEAMASGLPLIVTTHCGAADLVDDGVTGFVVPPRDPHAIAEKLAYLAAHPARCAEMGRAARQEAERHTQARYDRDLRDIFLRHGLLEYTVA